MDKEIIKYTDVNGITVIDNPSTDFPSHWHHAAEFTLVRKDGCRFRIADQEYAPEAGDVLLIWPRELHEVLNVPDKGSMFIQFSSTLIESNTDLASAARFFRKIHLISHREEPELTEKIQDLILNIRDVYNNKRQFIETKCKMLVYELLLLIGEYAMNSHMELIGNGRYSDKSWDYIRAACNYINEHSSEDISQTDVAEHTGLSSFYFSKLFNEYMGTSFPEYLSGIRVKNVINLLLNENLSVTECAFLAGFQSTTRFNKAFREVTGCTPREYRKLHAINV